MLRNKFLRNNIVNLASSVAGGFFGYLFHFLISHKISVAQYGELQSINSIMMIAGVFFSTVSFFMIKQAAVFSVHNDRDGQANFLAFVMHKFRFLSLVFGVVFLCSLPLIKHILLLENYWGVLAIGFSMMILFYSSFYSNSLHGWSDFVHMGAISLAVVIVKVVSGYVLAIFSPTASSVAMSFLLSAAFGWLIFRAYFHREWPRKREENNKMEWREKYFSGMSFRKSLINILFFSFGLALVSNVDIVIIKGLVAPQLAGHYAALSVLGKIVMWLNLAVISVLFPDACSDGHCGKPASRNAILGSYGLILLISLPSVLIFYMFSDFFVKMMFGADYVQVASNLWLFGIMAFFLSVMTLEAKLALARYEKWASFLLLVAAGILGEGIWLFHGNIYVMIKAVSSAYFCGWIMLLILNIAHRVKYKNSVSL